MGVIAEQETLSLQWSAKCMVVFMSEHCRGTERKIQ